jgi:hypothetical protein
MDQMIKQTTILFLCASYISVCGLACSEKLDKDLENLGRATGPVSNTGEQKQHGNLMQDKDLPKNMPPEMAHALGRDPASSKKVKVHTGEVVEIIQVPSYTYIYFKTGADEKLWAAVPTTKLDDGQSVQIEESIVMTNFASKSLGRTFPTIIFGTLKGQRAGHGTGDPTVEPGDSDQGTKWVDMTSDQKRKTMFKVVVPEMKKVFASNMKFGCHSCHGENMQEVHFHMPNTLYPLDTKNMPFDSDNAKLKATAQFMQTKVTPKMAQLLQLEVYNPETKNGFGCFGCHAKAQ